MWLRLGHGKQDDLRRISGPSHCMSRGVGAPGGHTSHHILVLLLGLLNDLQGTGKVHSVQLGAHTDSRPTVLSYAS